MTARITRFGRGSNVYTFPDTQQSFNTNFADLVPVTQRLPGLSGGFDHYGNDPAPSSIGRVQLTYYLLSATRSGMDTLRDACKRMAAWGKQPLWLRPTDGSAERWCMARVNNISINEDLRGNTDLWQPVNIIFQVSDPWWTGLGNSNSVWGSFLWGSGTWGGGTPTLVTGSGSITLTNNGSLATPVDITITPPAGEVAIDPIIRRIVNGEIVDEVKWTGTLTSADTLSIRASSQAVYLNAVNAYDSRFSALRTRWMQIEPGSNSIVVQMAEATNEANVNLRYLERYI